MISLAVLADRDCDRKMSGRLVWPAWLLTCLIVVEAVSCAPAQNIEATPLGPAATAADLAPTAYLPLVVTPESLPTERIQPNDLVYRGAFRLPDSPILTARIKSLYSLV
jgi:hypothetical protein